MKMWTLSALFLIVAIIFPVSQGVGFTATILSDDKPDVKHVKGEKIIFRHVITNDGSIYNAETGIFTAPESGMYFLSVSMASKRYPGINGNSMFSLMKKRSDSTPIHLVTMETDVRRDNQESSASNAVYLRLESGDQLWVEIVYIGPHERPLLKGNHQSSFTAFKLV